jgi:hypothetical protein
VRWRCGATAGYTCTRACSGASRTGGARRPGRARANRPGARAAGIHL